MGTALEYLEKRQPRGFICEEVVGFGTSIEVESGKPYIQVFQERAAALGYFTRSIDMDAKVWCQMGRPRYYIVGILAELGGLEAIEWIVEHVDEIVGYRAMSPPTPLFAADRTSVLKSDQKSFEFRRENQVGAPTCALCLGSYSSCEIFRSVRKVFDCVTWPIICAVLQCSSFSCHSQLVWKKFVG